MRAALLLAVVLCAAPADAATTAKYKMKGPCHVRTTEGVPFDETFEREMHAKVTGPDSDVRVEVSGKGHAPCTLKGKRAGGVITLTAGQVCSQKVTREGVSADVKGELTSGKAILKGKSITLVTKWNVEGVVKMPLPMPVKGVVDTNLEGTREN